jgi:hypothetical protein
VPSIVPGSNDRPRNSRGPRGVPGRLIWFVQDSSAAPTCSPLQVGQADLQWGGLVEQLAAGSEPAPEWHHVRLAKAVYSA